ncbi:hypothetical protein [Acidovorax sp.]|nr:hypothetical protein [Acidovorax sp.]
MDTPVSSGASRLEGLALVLHYLKKGCDLDGLEARLAALSR